jgi:glycosyltransferase involved in cell wall biosynthesis
MDWCDWFGRGGSVEERSNPLLRAVLRPLESFYEENFRHQADASTVINSALETRIRNLGIRDESILRLPNGVDPEKLQPQDKQGARHTLNMPENAPIIGYLGSLFPADATLMLQAFSQVREVHPDALLIMIGNPKAQLINVQGLIRTGFVSPSELSTYLAVCDILWLPLSDTIANRGRWPSKITNYFAAGRAVVACAVGDMAAVLEKSQAGIATAPTSTEFAKHTLCLLQDQKMMTDMAVNARRAAELDYNWKHLAQSVEKQYNDVLCQKP